MSNVGLKAQLACIWEATACKPGNVHRHADFDDAHLLDFLMSAAAIAPVMQTACKHRVGETVRRAVEATLHVVRTNTNLGIILLLAPLAAIADGQPIFDDVAALLRDLTIDDSRDVFQAIRLASPGGLGTASDQDVHGEPTLPLQQIMALAADRDLIARQYANGYREIRECGLPALLDGLKYLGGLEQAIIHCHLTLMAEYPDSLIARKRGRAEAEEAARRARAVLHARADATRQLVELDRWLRAEGRGRNPGTSADLVTACLFAALREDKIHIPLHVPWSVG
jgi:triphosphoribosyl-dephospho-CoA synthase